MSSNEHKKSETLRQRDKARKDFLELKEMQRKAAEGEVTEHVAYSREIKPKTFTEKVKHFLYYYWKGLVGAIVAIAVVAVATVSCLNKKNPDIKIVIYDNRILADMYISGIEDYFAKYGSDYNGDGEVVVSVINCTYETGVSTAQYQQTMMQRLQGIIVTDTECMLVITSEAGYEYFEKYLELPMGEGLPLPQSYYDECATQDELPIPDGMTVYCRDITGTLIENDEKSKQAVANGKEFINRLSQAQ